VRSLGGAGASSPSGSTRPLRSGASRTRHVATPSIFEEPRLGANVRTGTKQLFAADEATPATGRVPVFVVGS